MQNSNLLVCGLEHSSNIALDNCLLVQISSATYQSLQCTSTGGCQLKWGEPDTQHNFTQIHQNVLLDK